MISKNLLANSSRPHCYNKIMSHNTWKTRNKSKNGIEHTRVNMQIKNPNTSKIGIKKVLMDLLLSRTVSLPTSRRPICFGLTPYFSRSEVTAVILKFKELTISRNIQGGQILIHHFSLWYQNKWTKGGNFCLRSSYGLTDLF